MKLQILEFFNAPKIKKKGTNQNITKKQLKTKKHLEKNKSYHFKQKTVLFCIPLY